MSIKTEDPHLAVEHITINIRPTLATSSFVARETSVFIRIV